MLNKKELGINRKTFTARLRRGWSIERASNTPVGALDITGNKFGRLTAIKLTNTRSGHNSKWLFKCNCGNEKEIFKTAVMSGSTKSCGCIARERFLTHGAVGTKTYKVWESMKQRCRDKNCKSFINYGGRGIKICDQWLNSFPNFLEDMGERPTSKHSIDRISNNGNYEPSNCRWSTKKEQSRNRRSNVRALYHGKTQILIEWCEELNLPYKTIRGRVRNGWSIERAFETPVKLKEDKII